MALIYRKCLLFFLVLLINSSCVEEGDDSAIFCSDPLFPFFCPSAGKCCSMPSFGKNLSTCYKSLSECASSGQSCESCAIEPNNTIAQGYIYANWTCDGSSSCEAQLGAEEGTAGPFCDTNTCMAWGEKFIPGGFACANLPTNSPGEGAPPNGKCFEVGDF